MKLVLLVALTLVTADAAGARCSPLPGDPPVLFSDRERVFAGRVVGLTPEREFGREQTDQLIDWLREAEGDAFADSVFAADGYPRTVGLLVEVSSSVSGWPLGGQVVEVFPYATSGDCSRAGRDSLELAATYPVGTEVLVRGREDGAMRLPEETEWESDSQRIAVSSVSGDFVHHRPAGYDPASTVPFDYAPSLDDSPYDLYGRADVAYEFWKDLKRLWVHAHATLEDPTLVPRLRRLASYPWFVGCTRCYGRLVFTYLGDAATAADLLGHIAAVQRAHPAVTERFRTYGPDGEGRRR